MYRSISLGKFFYDTIAIHNIFQMNVVEIKIRRIKLQVLHLFYIKLFFQTNCVNCGHRKFLELLQQVGAASWSSLRPSG